MRLDRLLGITMALLMKRRVTAKELAARFEVSVRTIYRDIELINQSGIPVTSFSGSDGGFELMSGFFLTKQHFSLDDFSVIYNLLKGMEDVAGGQKFTSLVHKLSTIQPALLNRKRQENIIFDVSASEKEKEVIRPVLQAIDQSRRIDFGYTNAFGQLSERKIEPFHLLWERGIWYLEGYCLLRKDKRCFRVSRINNLKILEGTFSPRTEYNRPNYVQEMQGTQVHLRFDLKVQERVMEQFQGEFTRSGDFIDVQTIFYTRDYAISVILSYGSKVEIVSPDELKDDFIQQLEEIRKIYSH
jgi:predicted DNA-binding transcriptional regulator YafY